MNEQATVTAQFDFFYVDTQDSYQRAADLVRYAVLTGEDVELPENEEKAQC